ncbi:MAG TPA: coenzyme F420-0:L-glutamate ligase [Anaerolineae bacterium]|nr:coenzyme F420-0:L-glutamate ligase [Anaerolineae bacterium]
MTPSQLILTALPGIPLIEPGDDLGAEIGEALLRAGLKLVDGDVLAVTSKIVAKSEGRQVDLNDVTPSAEALRLAAETHKDPRELEVILGESRKVLRTRPGLIIVEHRLGFVCANAGVDHSNLAADGSTRADRVLLLPENPDASAHALRERFVGQGGVDVGVLIVDSHGRAWRMGTVGVAIGVAGFPALVDLRGEPDLFGEILQVTQIGLADEIAGAASALMGQADEGHPVVHVRGLPYPLRDGSLAELLRPEEKDLFR